MSLYDDYSLDPAAQNDGIWVEMRGGALFRIRSDSSDKVRQWSLRRAKAQRQVIIANEGIVPPALADKNEIALCAEVVITGWENVTDRAGAVLPYTEDNARQLMKDLPSLRRDILLVSSTEAGYRAEIDAVGKTSAPASAPSSSLAPAPTS